MPRARDPVAYRRNRRRRDLPGLTSDTLREGAAALESTESRTPLYIWPRGAGQAWSRGRTRTDDLPLTKRPATVDYRGHQATCVADRVSSPAAEASVGPVSHHV
jgi:hypothetical protein